MPQFESSALDYFAAAALRGLLHTENMREAGLLVNDARVAQRAYQLAAAMCQERLKWDHNSLEQKD